MRRNKLVVPSAVIEGSEPWSIVNGDSLEVLKQFPDNCVDAIVTDPPSSIRFMGAKWDSDKGGTKQWIEWLSLIMGECLRIVKPGGYAVVWALPRTSFKTGYALDIASWAIRDVICHVQSQGMPKGGSIKIQGWEGYGWNLKPTSEFWYVARKPFKGSARANLQLHGCGALNIEACRVKHSSPEDFERHKAQVEAIKARGGVRGGSWANDSDLSGANDVTPSGRWPSNIVFSHAPGCKKVGTVQVKGSNNEGGGTRPSGFLNVGSKSGSGKPCSPGYGDETGHETIDKWECVDGCAVKELDLQSGIRPSTLSRKGHGGPNPSKVHAKRNVLGGTGGGGYVYGDSGTASRFFKCFEADPFVYFAKPPKSEKNRGDCESTHPTVKSVHLMRYLCRLVTPPGGLILDAFGGSGTTCVAALHEGFRCIAIDEDPDFVTQSRSRVEAELELIVPKTQLIIPGV